MADTKLIDWGDGTGEKITVTASSFVGNKGLQIQSPENVKVTPRSKTIVLKSKTDPTKVVRINVTQQKAVYTYDFILTASVPTIAAKGGDSVITAQLKTYRNGNLVETKAVTPILSGTGTGFSISEATVTASNRTTVVGAERSITVKGKFSGTFDGQEVSATVVVKQEANSATSITYGTPVVSLSVSDIPASGGTLSSGTVTYSQTRVQNYTSGSTSTLTPLTSGGTVSYSTAVTASSLGTTVKSRTKIGTLTATVAMNGKSGSNSVDVYQQANEATYGAVSISGGTVSDIPASGGSVSSASGISAAQTVSFTSGSTRAGSVTITYGAAVTASSLGTTVKARTKIGTLTATASGEGGKSSQKSFDVYQQANEATTITYGDITVKNYSYPSDVPASGGSTPASLSYSQPRTQNYTSGVTSDLSPVTSGGTVSYSKESGSGTINTTSGAVSAGSRGTVIGDRLELGVFVVSISLNGKSVTNTVRAYQQANSLTWNNPVITYSYADIAASGGTVTPSLSITQSGSYTSGSTASNTTIGSKSFSGTGVNTSTGAYSASSLGTTVKTRTKLSTGTVSVTANGKSASKSADIYQAENKIERYNYGSWNITISANPAIIAYGGGKSIVSASCTRSKTPVYSSGATGPAGSESATPTLSGSATGFTLSGTTVTASANSWAATRSITVTASYSGATSKSVTITQSASPASISLNKTAIAFPQRASFDTVQVTCNSDWSVNSNAEFAVPETLQIKYNPSTDVVELVDQPIQIIKKVQESSDYALAFIRIGSHQEPYSHMPTKTISRSDIAAAKNSGGFNTKMNEWLVSQAQNKSYHRIVARNWFYNGNATQQIQAGTEGFRDFGMASLMPSDTLISKPGKALGLRNVGLKIPKSLRFLLVEVWKFYKLTSFNDNIEVETNNKTGRIQFTVTEFSNVADSHSRSPKESFMRCQSQIGPVGYILYKKASTTEYLDVRGWKEVSNFALARTLSDDEAKVKSIGNVEIVVIKFKYGED